VFEVGITLNGQIDNEDIGKQVSIKQNIEGLLRIGPNDYLQNVVAGSVIYKFMFFKNVGSRSPLVIANELSSYTPAQLSLLLGRNVISVSTPIATTLFPTPSPESASISPTSINNESERPGGQNQETQGLIVPVVGGVVGALVLGLCVWTVIKWRLHKKSEIKHFKRAVKESKGKPRISVKSPNLSSANNAKTRSPVMISSPLNLPPGWEVHVLKPSNIPYFYNPTTNESRWSPPPVTASPPVGSPDRLIGSPLPDERRLGPQTGQGEQRGSVSLVGLPSMGRLREMSVSFQGTSAADIDASTATGPSNGDLSNSILPTRLGFKNMFSTMDIETGDITDNANVDEAFEMAMKSSQERIKHIESGSDDQDAQD